jgi:hypothetical protein
MPKTDGRRQIEGVRRKILVRGRAVRGGRITAGGWKKKPAEVKIPLSRFWGSWRGKP